MPTADYTYRIDPDNPIAKPSPPNAEAARRSLEEGNQNFVQWIESCQNGSSNSQIIMPCNVREVAKNPKQAPFAVVVG